MGISLANNIPSIRVQSTLRETSNELADTFERLSSGLRINSASDDPAGLAIADSLRADSRIATAALQNVSEGISLAYMADTAMDAIADALQRMADLAGMSSNSTVTQTQRSAISAEFMALGSEIERIAKETTYNDITLLSNSRTIHIQTGYSGGTVSQISIPSILATLSALGLAPSNSSKLVYSVVDVSGPGSAYAAQRAYSAVNNALTSLSSRRGTIAAAESRLDIAVSNLQAARENFIEAESKIRDIDTAEEVSKMVRLQILQQSGVAALAHANLQPQSVLALLS